MASRRTRIKGIANIPQRKKINHDTNCNSDSVIPNSDKNECAVNIVKRDEIPDELSTDDILKLCNNSGARTVENNIQSHINNTNNESCFINELEHAKTEETQPPSVFNNITNEVSHLDTASGIIQETPTEVSQIKEIENPKTTVVRRKFLKPGINLSAVRKRAAPNESADNLSLPITKSTIDTNIKQEILEKIDEAGANAKPSERVVISEVSLPKSENKVAPVACDLTKIISRDVNNGLSNQGSSYSEITLNETHLGVNEVPVINSSIVTFSPSIKKIVPETHISDSEYPAPPPSPSKFNRARIKAIPRLSQRKTSCSASESEDETRKYGRIRNNSVCSVISTIGLEPPTPISETAPPKEITTNIPKKINRTEQSRKLAEARREFQKRFGSNNPDKQQLKMIDLIFYNPITNPMSQKNDKPQKTITQTEKESEEHIDDPSEISASEEKEKENNNAMPVPQIKIGPSGEIVLDEQSLIVENAEVAREKEKILNSQIIDGDFDTGYGIYKRAPRSLAWNQKETLRFYKALNLIGTDFTVMCQLFPKRSRRELKMKFKKEEKINKHLVDKAIMQPCSYNFFDLKREIEVEEEEEATLQKLKEEETKKLKDVRQQRREERKKKKDNEAKIDKSSPINDNNTNSNTDPSNDSIILPPKKRLKGLQKPVKVKPKPRKTKKQSLNINMVLEDSDADISDMETQSESEEEETIPFLKPTRSGRMPKSTTRYTTIVDEIPFRICSDRIKTDMAEETPNLQSSYPPDRLTVPDDATPKQPSSALRNRRSSSLSSLESNSEKLVPGAVVIFTEEDPSGDKKYKVYMVTPERKMMPLDLESDIVARLVAERQSEAEMVEFLVPSTPEKNVTIPAPDDKNNITTLGPDQDNTSKPEESQKEYLVLNCPSDITTE